MASPHIGSGLVGPLDAVSAELVHAETSPPASAAAATLGPLSQYSWGGDVGGNVGRSTPRAWGMPRGESFGSEASDFGILERGWTPRPLQRPHDVPALPLPGGKSQGLPGFLKGAEALYGGSSSGFKGGLGMDSIVEAPDQSKGLKAFPKKSGVLGGA